MPNNASFTNPFEVNQFRENFQKVVQRLIAVERAVERYSMFETPLGGGGTSSVSAAAPFVTMALDASLTNERVLTEGAGLDLVDGGAGVTVTLGLGLDSILLAHVSGLPATEYAFTDAGLDLAIAAASAGDEIHLPVGTLTASHTLVAGVGLRGSGDLTILSGGVVGPTSGTSYIYRCTLSLASDAGISVGNGNVIAWHCRVGGKYAVKYTGGGDCTLYFGSVTYTDYCAVSGNDGSTPVSLNSWSTGFTALVTGTSRTDSTPDWNIAGVDTVDFQLYRCTGITFDYTGGYFQLDLGRTQGADARISVRYYKYQYGESWNFGDARMTIRASTNGTDWSDIATDETIMGNYGWYTQSVSITNWRYIRVQNNSSTTAFYTNAGIAYVQLTDANINTITVVTNRLITHGVAGAGGSSVPLAGDHAVYDALNYQSRHANDIDNPDGIHWTKTALDAAYAGGTSGTVSADYLTHWLTPWSYRQRVVISNSGEEKINQQVAVDLDLLALIIDGKAKTDLADLRVTAGDGQTLRPFYLTGVPAIGDEANWTRYASNPIIDVGAGGAWDSHWVHPHSVIDNGGTLYMYYGGDSSASPTREGLATSTDGLSWTKYGSNPIFSPGTSGQWDDTRIDHFTVRKEGANWYAWYGGDGGDGVWRVGYATSSDGMAWTRYGSNPVLQPGAGGAWDSAFVIPSCVLQVGNTYYLFYWGGTSADQSTWCIGVATSTDRVTWTKSGSNPVLSGVGSAWDDGVLDVDVFANPDGTYTMFYQGNTSDQNNSAIGVATSPDLLNWTRDADNPFPRGAGGTWDDAWDEGPVIRRVGNDYYLYYMGYDGSTVMRIGARLYNTTRLWVTVSSVPAGGEVVVYVYYGNPDATSVSTGSAGSPDVDLTNAAGAEETRNYAAWDTANEAAGHARDIAEGMGLYHLPAGADVGDTVTWNGSVWVHQAPTGAEALDDLTDVDTTGVADGDVLAYDEATQTWLPVEQSVGTGLSASGDFYGVVDGALAVAAGAISFVVPRACTIAKVLISCATKGSSGSTVVDVNQNGTTIFTTQGNRPTMAYNEANNYVEATPDVTSLSKGDILGIDIDGVAVGSAGLRVTIAIRVGSVLALDDLSDVDTSGAVDGAVLRRVASSNDWQDYPLGVATNIVNNGSEVRIGDADSANYVSVNTTTGNLRLLGNAVAWDDLRLAGSSARLGATSPTLAAFGPSGSIRTLRFDAGQHDEIYFEIQMPHNWLEGSDIYPHVHWAPVSATAGNVVWQLDYIWANINEAFGAPTTMTSDATAAGGTAWVHKLSMLKDGSSHAYIVGAGKTLSSMLVCRLHRNAGAGSDTLAADVAFLEFDLHYQIDGFGSDEEYKKNTQSGLLLESGDYLLQETGDRLLLE